MNYYDKLNQIIKDSLIDKSLYSQFYYFNDVANLSSIIIENTNLTEYKDYETKVPLESSVEIVKNFFSSINKEYASMFQNILQEENIYDNKRIYSVQFHKIPKCQRNNSLVRKDGLVIIDYDETLDDVYTVAHEFTHKFSQPKNQNSTIKQFLGETTSLTIEFLLQDYLLKKTLYDEDEIKVRKNNRLLAVKDDAAAIIFEHTLLKLYQQNNGCLNQDILLNYLESMDKDSEIYKLFSKNGYDYLNDIVKNGTLSFPKRQRYVIGTLLASDLHDKIENDKTNIKQLVSLITILGKTDLTMDRDLKSLTTLDLPLINNGKIEINDNTLTNLTACYKNEIANLSHTNGSNLPIRTSKL